MEGIKEFLQNNEEYYLQTKNKKTKRIGAAAFTKDGKIKVFEGAGDGSDDKKMSYAEFKKNYNFEIKKEF